MRMGFPKIAALLRVVLPAVCLWLSVSVPAQAGSITNVTVSPTRLIVRGSGGAGDTLLEASPVGGTSRVSAVVDRMPESGAFERSIPRFDGARDRVYSGFALGSAGTNDSPRFAEDWIERPAIPSIFPNTQSKKGLQVQMVEDAIKLGVKHAALNYNLGQMVDLSAAPGNIEWVSDGETYRFHRGYIEHTDRQVKALSDQGITVSLIVLSYRGGNEALNRILLHPSCSPASPNGLGAFNTATPEGYRHLKACMEFLSRRYSGAERPFGTVQNYIVGNEVNSHWFWCNMGRVSMEEFALDYLRAVRLFHTATRKYSDQARVYVSLEHHWNIRYPGGAADQTFPARPFLEFFAAQARAGGDFDWHVAFHPYPENLFECRTWNDKSATRAEDTPRITFKNIDLLPRHLRRPEMTWRGQPRRVILSEQGFHSKPTPEGEALQAAAYCYAYRKVASLDGIDAFIYHRQVDHRDEGGLNLGLWRRNLKNGSAADPDQPKPIYEVFRQADTPEWENGFRFALPLIGISAWENLDLGRP